MNFRSKAVAGLVGLALACAATVATAAPTLFTNATGLTGTFIVQDFESATYADTVLITNQFTGITLNNGVMNPQAGFLAPNFIGNFSFTGFGQFPDLQISFNSVVTGAAFQLVTNGGTSTFNAFLNNALVGTGALATSTSVAYYGFTGGAFNRIQVLAPGNAALLIDNVQSQGVPEPATWAMMLMGFGGLGLALRTRRARAFA